MKKILLATTMLIGTAGFAAAEVTVSGSARMGITDTNAPGDAGKPQFSNRVRVNFSMSGETENGLSFGASVRADQASDANATGNSGSVFISGAFGKLSMGDVDGGDKAMTGQIPGVDFFAGGSFNEVSYVSDGAIGGFLLGSSNTGVIATPSLQTTATLVSTSTAKADGVGEAAKVNYTYSADAFSFSVSHSQNGTEKSSGIGAKYSANNLTVALGYGSATAKETLSGAVYGLSALGTAAGATLFAAGEHTLKVDQVTAAGAYDFGVATVSAIVQNTDVKFGGKKIQDVRSVGLAISGKQDAIGYGVFAKQDAVTNSNVILNDKVTLNSFGIGGTYDLGGGAVASISFESRENAGAVSAAQTVAGATATRAGSTRDTVAEVGVTFAF